MINKKGLLGMSKTFVIILALALIIGWKAGWINFWMIMGIYIVGKIIWNILT